MAAALTLLLWIPAGLQHSARFGLHPDSALTSGTCQRSSGKQRQVDLLSLTGLTETASNGSQNLMEYNQSKHRITLKQTKNLQNWQKPQLSTKTQSLQGSMSK